MKPNRVYVVEVAGARGYWHPVVTTLAFLAAQRAKADWQHANPDDTFRVRRYAPQETGR